MDLSTWILSIVGVAVLTLLVDILIPEGETAKYIKSVFSILTVLIIISPLPSFFKSDFTFESFFENTQATVIDYEYAQALNDSRVQFVEERLCRLLTENGLECEVKVQASFDKGFITVNSVDIKIKKSVIDDEKTNIDIIRKIVKQHTGVDGGDITIG